MSYLRLCYHRPTSGGELLVGQKLGRYRIEEMIGAGGMGVVYRAYDEKLHRQLAIKVLTPGTLNDEAARKRFRNEALALSRLNHPAIQTIHDFENFDGNDYLVSELVPGASLDAHLRSRELSEKEVIQLGIQLAQGLAAAHEAGIVHRDLKPSNLRVTPDGRLKILDFGLAAPTPEKVSTMTTQSMVSGSVGVSGTLPYMSPEQLLGEDVDARSDIYSAGVVLFELATQRLPFHAPLAPKLTDAILHQAPPSAKSLAPRLSAEFDRIVAKCLDKDRELRYQSAKELVADLRRLESTSSAVTVATPQRERARRWLMPAIATTILCALFAGTLWLWPHFSRSRHAGLPALRLEQLTNFTDAALWPALSPDGKMLAFVRRESSIGGVNRGSSQVYLKMLPDGDSVQITNDELTKGPLAFSRDGTRIAYSVIDNGFSWDTWGVSVLGGKEQPLLKNASGLSWMPDGRLVYSEMDHGLHMRVVTSKENRTEVREIYSPQKSSGMAHRSALSPDGKWLLLAEMDEAGWLPCRVVPFDGSSSGHRVGPASGQCLNAAWSPNGDWVYVQSNSGGAYHIWQQAFPDGAPEQLTSGPTEEQGIAVSPDGKSIVTAMGKEESTLWIHDPHGDTQVTSEGFAQVPIFSPTGNKLYFLQRSGDDPGFVTGELWALDLATAVRAPILRGFHMSHFSVSDDGKNVAYSVVEPADQSGLWLASLEGRSPPRRLSNNREDRVFFLHSGDIVTLGWDGKDRHLFRIDRDGNRRKLLEEALLYLLAVSPDDKWVIAATPLEGSEKGTVATKAFSLAGGGSRIICSACAPGGADARRDATVASWSRDGKMFYFSSQYFSGMGNRFFTAAVPLRYNEMLPSLPAEGIGTATDLLSLPGAIRIDERNVIPGNDSRHYSMRRILDKKNLFRVVLPD